MGATEFVKRLLGKPVIIDGADYSYEDGFDHVPQADFRPLLAENNARVLALPPEALAELDADLLTEEEEVEDEAAWELALASARQGALQSTLAPVPAVLPERPATSRVHRMAQPAAQPTAQAAKAAVSHGRSSRLPMQAPARRSSPRPSLSDPLARAAGLARAKGPVAPAILTPALAEAAPRVTRSMVSLSSAASSEGETTAVASPRRRRDPTQQLVSRPTTVLTGPEVRRVDAPAPSKAPAKVAPTPARARPVSRSTVALTSPGRSVEREEDWEAMIARAKSSPAGQPPFETAPDEWALALETARGGRVSSDVEPDWEAALLAAKARC